MLLHVPQVLPPHQVLAFREELLRAEWVDGRVSVGPQGAQVKQNRQLKEDSPLAIRLGEAILEAVMGNPLFFSAALPLRFLPPYFSIYEPGEQYGYHVDGAIRTPKGATGRTLRTDLSCTLFLSEPDEYEGGELTVVDTYGTHEVKLPAGDLILYPSTSLHRVSPVTRGRRMVSFFWLQSMVRDNGQRAHLFDIDQNLQSLRAQHGEAPELVALTGTYHNLLRMWAEL
ncbi:Fe2+-dependent dioxygenase [Ideonella dechloratans]|uniref:Fe2+-dependent dioxygenase n=1 Tax=Ideonella dechloratans TaxID=36863 RepID=UPI0035ADE3CC